MNASPAPLISVKRDHGVPFQNLSLLHKPLLPVLRRQLDEVVNSSAFVGGRWLEQFEQEWAHYCGTDHAIGVANGTEALELVLRSLGIGPGDEVVVPANTFVATPAAVVAAGARPVFVDVDPGTLLVTEATLLSALGPATAAIILVHLYGQMVDVESIMSVANDRGIAVIEDAAQAHGATSSGRAPGSASQAATFSFYPGKNLGALGDGGMVITNDLALARRIASLRNHGRGNVSTEHIEVGRNSRLDGLQAAFLSAKLPYLDSQNRRRQELAALYKQRLGDSPLVFVENRVGNDSVYHIMAAQIEGRDRVRYRLAEHGIETSVHYPIPCHRQPAFERFGTGYLPIVERAATRLLSLPIFPAMTEDQVHEVCGVIEAILNERRRQ